MSLAKSQCLVSIQQFCSGPPFEPWQYNVGMVLLDGKTAHEENVRIEENKVSIVRSR